jgi:hypothetical protein
MKPYLDKPPMGYEPTMELKFFVLQTGSEVLCQRFFDEISGDDVWVVVTREWVK